MDGQKSLNITLNTQVIPSKDVLLKEVDGEAVILHLAKGSYFGLDEVGTDIWNAVSKSHKVSSAFEKLVDTYDVEPATLEQEVTEFVSTLVDQGILEVSQP